MKFYHNHKSGFTLIECILVIGLLSGLSIIFFSAFELYEKHLELIQVEQLYLSCMHMQQYAQVTNRPQELIFDSNRHCYTFLNNVTSLRALEFGSFTSRSSGPPDLPTTFKHHKIDFYPSGIISAGTIYLMNIKKTRMYAISSSVSSVSFLRKYQYDGAWKPYS